MTVPHIEVHGLCRRYVQGDSVQNVLVNASFALGRGEIVALLGRSGSGKSTLLNLLSGIDLPDAGTVTIDGIDLASRDERQRTLFRRRHIGFIYQSFNLVPSLTAAENIALVLELNGVGVAAALQQAQTALESVGLRGKASQLPSRLSGGEQQRVAILRALVHHPALVLADEPTGSLDAVSGGQMLELLRDSLRIAGSTGLLVTHSLRVAQSADRVLTLENGIVTERTGDFAW
jgi:putative ABC transport system ATP-binding protein